MSHLPAILAALPAPLASLPQHARLIVLVGAGALGLTLLLTAVARRLRQPPILLFLLGGLCVGQCGLQWLNPAALGNTWPVLLTLGVELVLFVSGLCLPPHGFREIAWETRGILTSGVLVTWGLVGTTLHLLHPAFPWRFCLLAGSLAIATGPAVVAPLLQRIHLRKRLHHLLHWEAVLTDPIGAILALLCFELASMPPGASEAVYGRVAVGDLAGLLLGGLGGILLTSILRQPWLSPASAPVVLLTGAAVIPVACDLILPGTGLLGALLAGLTVGRADLPVVRLLRRNRSLLMELIGGPLFVGIAAHLTRPQLHALGWYGLLTVLVAMFVVRPLNVFLSTAGGSLQTRERWFLSWVAPRGILAAALAAVFAIDMPVALPGTADAGAFLEAFACLLIAGTVLQGLAAGRLGRAWGVIDPRPSGWLIAGAHALARQVAAFVRNAGFHVVLADEDVASVAQAQRQHLSAMVGSALTLDIDEHPNLYGIGAVLAVTASAEMNARICRRFAEEHPEFRLYRWSESAAGSTAPDSPASAGRVVWSMLRAADLRRADDGADDAAADSQTLRVADVRHPERVLLCLHAGQLEPTLPADPLARVQVLIYQPATVGLDLNLNPDWVIYSHATNMADVLAELLQRLQHSHPHIGVDDVCRNLVRQEREYSSYVGYEVALPHFHLEALSSSVVLVAKLHQPFADPHSGLETRYVFLVLSPSSQPRTHLQALAEISRYIMDEDNRLRLKAVVDTAGLRHLFFPRLPATGQMPAKEAPRSV